MKRLITLSIVLWIAMGIAFYLDSPVGYLIPILGLAASVAIATEFPEPRAGKGRRRAAVGAQQ